MGRKPCNNKDEILKKGVEAIWLKGYHGTSVNDIVKAASIPKGSFYFHFHTKEDFILEAIRSTTEESISQYNTIFMDENLSAMEKIEKIYDIRIDMAVQVKDCKYGCLIGNLSQEMSSTNERVRTALSTANKEMNEPMVQCLQKAMDEGKVRTQLSASELVSFMENSWKGALVQMKTDHDAAPLYLFKNLLFSKILN